MNTIFYGNIFAIGEIFSDQKYWLGIFTSALIVFVRHRIKLPKVRVTGTSGGGENINGEQFSYGGLVVSNIPSFFGYPIARESLNIATAIVYDSKTNRPIGHLMRWRKSSDDALHKTEIKAGESDTVFLNGVYRKRVHHYVGSNPNDIERSDTLVENGSDRAIEIHIVDNLQRKYKIKLKISANPNRSKIDGVNVSVRTKINFSDRCRDFSSGFRDMVSAFTRPSY